MVACRDAALADAFATAFCNGIKKVRMCELWRNGRRWSILSSGSLPSVMTKWPLRGFGGSFRMNDIREMVQKRILVLDGAMGTMIQARHLDAAAFRDFRTKTNETSCNEVLNLNRPDVIESIHRAYLDVGADIIETNTFCATRFSLAEYSLQDDVRLINMAACDIAQRARGNKKPGSPAISDRARKRCPCPPRWRTLRFVSIPSPISLPCIENRPKRCSMGA